MPKMNWIAVLAASAVFYVIGFVWYGVVFADAWMSAMGVTEEDAGGEPVWMALGAVITILQVIGLALVLKWKGAARPADAAQISVILWALFALPFTLYGYAYLPDHNATLLMIDAGHLLVGWVAAAVVLTLFKQA
jgi:hypothetical protein